MTTLLITMVLLGAAHGLNPAMGWLFAVGLGLQEQKRAAVWRALGPMALGHALAIALVVVLAAAVGVAVPTGVLKWIVAGALFAFGTFHLARHRHPRWGGMRVGPRDLTVWSFLMASAHGAGLMVLPFVLGAMAPAVGGDAHGSAHGMHMLAAGMAGGEAMGLLATAVHTAGYLLVTGAIAVLVYEKLGLRLLRAVWINLNAVWAAALIATAVLTPLL